MESASINLSKTYAGKSLVLINDYLLINLDVDQEKMSRESIIQQISFSDNLYKRGEVLAVSSECKTNEINVGDFVWFVMSNSNHRNFTVQGKNCYYCPNDHVLGVERNDEIIPVSTWVFCNRLDYKTIDHVWISIVSATEKHTEFEYIKSKSQNALLYQVDKMLASQRSLCDIDLHCGDYIVVGSKIGFPLKDWQAIDISQILFVYRDEGVRKNESN